MTDIIFYSLVALFLTVIAALFWFVARDFSRFDKELRTEVERVYRSEK